MTVVIYRSTDTSAPTLSGTANSLVALLDACLVNGYGSKAAAGWSKPYTGTNAAAFRQGSSGFYINVDDNGPGVGTFKEARIRGYETMSAYNTGTGPFPTVAQQTNGLFVRKSTTADGTARAWIVAADAKTFYVHVLTGDTANLYMGFGFGDFYSYTVGDTYKCMIFGRQTENTGAAGVDELNLLPTSVGVGNGLGYCPRTYTGFGASVVIQHFGDLFLQWSIGAVGQGAAPLGPITFPNPGTGGLYLAAQRLKEGGANAFSNFRGELRGMFHQCHAASSFNDGDTFDGSGELAGRSFLFLKFVVGTTSTNAGVATIETTDWPTSP